MYFQVSLFDENIEMSLFVLQRKVFQASSMKHPGILSAHNERAVAEPADFDNEPTF